MNAWHHHGRWWVCCFVVAMLVRMPQLVLQQHLVVCGGAGMDQHSTAVFIPEALWQGVLGTYVHMHVRTWASHEPAFSLPAPRKVFWFCPNKRSSTFIQLASSGRRVQAECV